MTRRASLLERRIVVLDAMNHLLHYWHVLHKPFAYVMLIFMFAHIGISVAFGYRWVF